MAVCIYPLHQHKPLIPQSLPPIPPPPAPRLRHIRERIRSEINIETDGQTYVIATQNTIDKLQDAHDDQEGEEGVE